MLLNNFDRYKSIFEHYGFESNQDEDFTQRNENKNKKKKKINAKTTKNVSRDSTSKVWFYFQLNFCYNLIKDEKKSESYNTDCSRSSKKTSSKITVYFHICLQQQKQN